MATRQCNRMLLADKHTEVADEDLFLTVEPEPIENQDNGSEGEDSDKVGNDSEGNDNVALDNLNDRDLVIVVTFIPCMPQKPSQNADAARAHDLKRHACDIARDSQGMEDQIRAMVSSYMAPDEDDEDPELMIGRLVC